MRFLFAPLLMLALTACAKPVDPDPAVNSDPEQAQALILSSLDTADMAAPAWTDFFASAEQTAGCVTFAALDLVAPVVRDSLEQAFAQAPVAELPAVQGSAASCDLPTVELLDPAEVEKYSNLAWGNFYAAIAGFGPQLQSLDCKAYVITMATGEYVHTLAPALIQVPATWTISVPAHLVDYSPCGA